MTLCLEACAKANILAYGPRRVLKVFNPSVLVFFVLVMFSVYCNIFVQSLLMKCIQVRSPVEYPVRSPEEYPVTSGVPSCSFLHA